MCGTDGDLTLRILLYSLIFLVSVIGNLLIIVVLTVNKRMRTVTNTFLLSLAVSDLMMAVFCMPFTLIPSILKDFIFGAAMCKTVSYFMGETNNVLYERPEKSEYVLKKYLSFVIINNSKRASCVDAKLALAGSSCSGTATLSVYQHDQL